MNFQEFFYKYFLEPMELEYGFNLVNTIVYAIIVAGLTYLIFRIIKSLKIKIDEKLALSIFPFVLFAGSFRVLEDLEILKGYIFKTPGIWFLFFGITLSVFLISVFLQRRKGIPYYKIMFISGISFFAIILGMLRYKNPVAVYYVFLWLVPWLLLLKLIRWSIENKMITGIHMFDSVTTFVSIEYFGYFEQHVLPRFVIGSFGTFSFVILKFVVVLSVLFLLDKYSDDKEFGNFIKIIIGILGLGPGMRDFLRLVCLT